jgi:hypothetical protein
MRRFQLHASDAAMKISRTGSLNSSSLRRTRQTKSSGSKAVASHLSPQAETASRQSIAGVHASNGVDALLAVQEVGDALDSHAQAHQRATDTLDRLDDLRHGLLAGMLSRPQVENLARLVRLKREAIDDPRLIEILDQIELRAEIELAKYSTLD